MSKKTKSPCTGVCKIGEDGLCRGCFRSRNELRAWKSMGDAEKAAINARVRPLIKAAKGPKKARKLDKKIAKTEKRLTKLRLKRVRLAVAQAAE